MIAFLYLVPADYALFVQGQLLDIIEPKKISVGAQNILEQAKQYSKHVFDILLFSISNLQTIGCLGLNT